MSGTRIILRSLHAELSRRGQYYVARKVLRLLAGDTVVSGLDDVSWAFQDAVDELQGVSCRISADGRVARHFLTGGVR